VGGGIRARAGGATSAAAATPGMGGALVAVASAPGVAGAAVAAPRVGGAMVAAAAAPGAGGATVAVAMVTPEAVGGSPASDYAEVIPDEDSLAVHKAMEFHLGGRQW
jgi:hypothetical protein